MNLEKVSRRNVAARLWRTAAGLVFALAYAPARAEAALDIQDHYSPRSRTRPVRPETRYIVLHTTEGGDEGSLRKVWKRGETHYLVTRNGRVYRIVNRSRIATHAGRSMWEGRGPIDNYSIGIEVVGYHNKDITDAQYSSVRELLRQLKSVYRIPDEAVLTHSMVAYGRPNRFHPYNHRGRKRCGMIFARLDVRERLGLDARPSVDLDVQAGRLKVADVELQRYLFQPGETPAAARLLAEDTNIITRDRTAWDIARDLYNSPDTIYVLPDGGRQGGDQIADWGRIPPGTRVLVGEDEANGFEGFIEASQGASAQSIAGEAFADKTTIYLFPSGMVRTGSELRDSTSRTSLLENLPPGTRVLVGYVYGGHIKSNRLPARIAGKKWNYPSTYYRLPDGRILSGDEIDAQQLPANTLVLFQS